MSVASQDEAPSSIDTFALAGAAVLTAAIAFALGIVLGPSPLVLGLVVAAFAALYFGLSGRSRRRRAVARRPFPSAWRSVLERSVTFYRGLDDRARQRFEREVAWFLDEQRISGPQAAPIDDDIRVLVAASAVTLSFGRPGYTWPRARDVVVYGDAFDEEYRVAREGSVLGMVHAQGPIVLSSRALRHGFKSVDDGLNVGLHELAHVLDFETGSADGIPSMMPWRSIEPWLGLMHSEITRVKKHKSLLRKYAATNDAEFFAVATEAFFERPRALRARHADLYDMLVETYGQDPAAREETRR